MLAASNYFSVSRFRCKRFCRRCGAGSVAVRLSLDTRTVMEITMIIMKFIFYFRSAFLFFFLLSSFFLCSSCSKVSTHALVRDVCAWGWGTSEACSFVADIYIYWHVQVDFLCPKSVFNTHTHTHTYTHTEGDRESERHKQTQSMMLNCRVSVSRLSKGRKTVDITMIIRLISYISQTYTYACQLIRVSVCGCVCVCVTKLVWLISSLRRIC